MKAIILKRRFEETARRRRMFSVLNLSVYVGVINIVLLLIRRGNNE